MNADEFRDLAISPGMTFRSPLSRRDAIRILGAAMASVPFARGLRGQDRPTPNVLFMMTDEQRKDAMSAYGNAILKTPNMDRIADEGVRFEEAFVTSSLCAENVGRVLDFLDAEKLAADTIVIYTSDDGFFLDSCHDGHATGWPAPSSH